MKLEQYLKNLGLSIKDAESIFGEVITEYIKCCSDESQDVAVSNNVDEITKAILSLMNSKEGRKEIQEYAKNRNITLSEDIDSTPINLDFETMEEDWEEIEEDDYIPEDIYEDFEEVEEVEPEAEVEVEAEGDSDSQEDGNEGNNANSGEEEEVEEVEPETEMEEVEAEVEPEIVEEVEVEEVEPETEMEEVEAEGDGDSQEDGNEGNNANSGEEDYPVMGSFDEEGDLIEPEKESQYYKATINSSVFSKRKDFTITDMVNSISYQMRIAKLNFIAKKSIDKYVWQFGGSELMAIGIIDFDANKKVFESASFVMISTDKMILKGFASVLIEDEKDLDNLKIFGYDDDNFNDEWMDYRKEYKQITEYNYVPVNRTVIPPRTIQSLLSLGFSDILYMLRLYDYQRLGKDKGLLEFGVENCVPKDYPKYLWNNFSIDVNKGFDAAKIEMVQIELVEEGLIEEGIGEIEDFKSKLTSDGYMLCEFIINYIFPKGTTYFGSIYYPSKILYFIENTYVSVADDTTLYGNSAFMEIGGKHLDYYLIDNSKETIKESSVENKNSAYYKKMYDLAEQRRKSIKPYRFFKEMGYKFPFSMGEKGDNKLEEGIDFGKDFLPQTVLYKGNTIGSTIFSRDDGRNIVVDTALINYFTKYYGDRITLVSLMDNDSLVGVIGESGTTANKVVGLIKANGKSSETNACISVDNVSFPTYLALYSQNAWISEYESQTQLKDYEEIAMEISTPNPMSELLTKSAEEILENDSSPETEDVRGMLERKIKARKMLLEDMQEDGEDKDAIKKLSFRIEIYEDQLEEFNQ